MSCWGFHTYTGKSMSESAAQSADCAHFPIVWNIIIIIYRTSSTHDHWLNTCTFTLVLFPDLQNDCLSHSRTYSWECMWYVATTYWYKWTTRQTLRSVQDPENAYVLADVRYRSQVDPQIEARLQGGSEKFSGGAASICDSSDRSQDWAAGRSLQNVL